MFRRWARGHKSLLATATSGSLVAALVATVAIVSNGYTAQRLDLSDASVWVANGIDRVIGRANTEILELNSVVASGTADIDIVQRGGTVLLLDRADATVGIVDAATSTVSDSIPLPPERPDVLLAGDNAVIYSQGTGEVWITPVTDLARFDSEQQPTLSLGTESVVSVDPAGLVFAFSPEMKAVYRVDAAVATAVDATAKTQLGGDSGEYAVTSVAGQWAVLDVDDRKLEVAGRVVDLADDVAIGGEPVLQRANDAGTSVLIAHANGLLSVPVDGAAPRVLVDADGGRAAAPVVVGACSYASWSSGEGWRRCGADGESTSLRLGSMPSSARLAFQVNQSRVLLNDATSGASWAVQRDGELIDNWDDLITIDDEQPEEESNDDSTPPVIEEEQLPPVAVDDSLGARPGRASVLPVLLNDYDPNADVMVIQTVTDIDPAIGRLDPIDNRQKLQVTLEPGANGILSFGYTIDDGRGGTAEATVTLAIRADGENSPPQQARATKTTVAAGGQVTVPVLGDWVDPDGDAFYLASASVAAPTTVSFRPEGTVVVTDTGATAGDTTVALAVSDGSAVGGGGLIVRTRAAGDVPIIADPFVALAHAGQEITIAPLEHVRGGTGQLRLNAVPAKAGVTVSPSFETGTFRFQTDQIRAHYVEYVVTDNDKTVTGLVRVDVVAAPEANTTPITVPKTVFVRTLSSKTVDVAATDIDPAGGVLLVTDIVNVPSDSGLRAEVLEQRSVRVTLTSPLDAPVTFGYRITNGLAEAQGTITVIEVPPPSRLQPPIARDDTATVRVGDAITIDVMSNDEHPDGDPITLNPVLIDGLSGDSGLLFASGDTLRYLAPATTGNFTAVYEIIGPLGQTAQGRVSIEVREPNVDTNHPPVPATVVSRVVAGERVLIDIPLAGIDPDGDSVQLLGQETSPGKGGVVAVGDAHVEYEADDYSAGTDSFTYTVIDALGARATGTVRVGIIPRSAGGSNPVAVEDLVTARPGATVLVQALANDSDADGGALEIVSVEPNDETVTATIDGGSIVRITVPRAQGTYGLVYSIENERGGSSSNFISVAVSEDAPLAYPVVRDTVLTLSDVLDRTSVDVDVLRDAFFADGNARSLDLAIVGGYGGSAEVTAGKRIRVTVGDDRQIIPFAVSHPDSPAVRSYAFIWVPGYKDALPQLDRDAPALQVISEDTLTIDLADHVVAVGGKTVRLTDSSTVRATNSNGAPLVVDAQTLRFTSADLYFGAASIAFEVTDGTSATDPSGRTATLVLPITVTPRKNQPPAFSGASIDFEPGQSKVIDLTELTSYPYDDDLDELAYTVEELPSGFSHKLVGQTLTIQANEDAAKSSVATLGIGVRDALAAGQSGRIELRVVPSTRPLAIAAADAAITRRGQSTVIDVLANDEATNPFPGQPLRVVAVRGVGGEALPAGVTVSASADNRRLTVTVAESAAPVDASVQYQIADATRDADRNVWGQVRISVQDVPDAPARPARQAGDFVEGELLLRLTAPQHNNAPISNYRVISTSSGYSFDCGTALVCSLPGLTVGAKYQFQVIATNAIGDSAPSAASDPYSIDYLPAAPVVTAAPTPAREAPSGGSITVSWPSVADPSPGSPIIGYTVEIDGRAPLQLPRSARSATIPDLPTATTFTVAVHARNSAPVTSPADWRRSVKASVTTVGPPLAPNPGPAAVGAPDGTIQVSWGAFGANGGAEVVYSIRRVAGEPTATDCTLEPTARRVSSPWTDRATTDGTGYTYFVFADNGMYCTAVSTGQTVSKPAPGKAVGSATTEVNGSPGGQLDLRADRPAVTSGTAERLQVRLNNGAWGDVTDDQWLTSAANTSHYGLPTTVSYRGCRDTGGDAFCGPASDPVTLVPINARAGVQSCVIEQLPVASTPANAPGADVGHQFAFAYERQIVPGGVSQWTDFSYGENDPVPSNAIAVRVKATVTAGSDTFTDEGYGGDTTCS